MKTSNEWFEYFKSNLNIQRINWNQRPSISNVQKDRILKSLQAWQLGETSDGAHLLKASMKYSKRVNDPQYIEAVKLFIKEEQKHGENLGIYLDMIQEERVKSDWGDTLFRKVRYFATSMELWTVTVLTVESAAQLFYQCLKDATECPLLKEICTDILIDEVKHIQFQTERLTQLYSYRAKGFRTLSRLFYRFFYFSVIRVIWMAHRKAFKAGGISKEKYLIKMKRKFNNTFGSLNTKRTVLLSLKKSGWSVAG